MKVEDLKHDSFYLYCRDNKLEKAHYKYSQILSINDSHEFFLLYPAKNPKLLYLKPKQIEENVYLISKLYELLYL